uniref:Cytochrome C and Quinol oxidase polypeptide I n=1 Tax=mine drainage metagenome TaxID=410659 RepID=E6QVI1_9ZZZZ
MHKRNRWFVTIGLIYGLVGGAVALTFLSAPTLIPGNVPRIHGHIMLLGFILMFIYGIALHVLPRFSGQTLYSERMANWQLYLANAGLPLMIAGWLLWENWLVLIGGALSYVGIVLFSINIVMTVRPKGLF